MTIKKNNKNETVISLVKWGNWR